MPYSSSRPIPPLPDSVTQNTNGRHAWRRAAVCWKRWWASASAALARAEQHIIENFRQPPHGG